MELRTTCPSFDNRAFSSVSSTCNQIDVLMILPHVFFKQVDDGCQSRWVLQNGTDVSARQKVWVKMQSFGMSKSQNWTEEGRISSTRSRSGSLVTVLLQFHLILMTLGREVTYRPQKTGLRVFQNHKSPWFPADSDQEPSGCHSANR